jgi:hypothetical protein
VKLGREANLNVSHPLRLAVLAQFTRRPLERFAILKHGHRVAKSLEILSEAGVPGTKDRLPKAVLGQRRQLDAALAGQFDERRQAHRAIEVDVQVGFWQAANHVTRHHASLTTILAPHPTLPAMLP